MNSFLSVLQDSVLFYSLLSLKFYLICHISPLMRLFLHHFIPSLIRVTEHLIPNVFFSFFNAADALRLDGKHIYKFKAEKSWNVYNHLLFFLDSFWRSSQMFILLTRSKLIEIHLTLVFLYPKYWVICFSFSLLCKFSLVPSR